MTALSDPLDFFWARVNKTETCWLWTGDKLVTGYPRFTQGKKPWLAHRWSHLTFVGPIPDGYEVDHLCRVVACVRPDHLEAVTGAENLRRQAEANRKSHCINGHDFAEGNNTRHRRDNGRRYCGACARERMARNAAAKRAVVQR